MSQPFNLTCTMSFLSIFKAAGYWKRKLSGSDPDGEFVVCSESFGGSEAGAEACAGQQTQLVEDVVEAAAGAGLKLKASQVILQTSPSSSQSFKHI